MSESNWNAKGAALSDKSAREEFGLTQEEIHDAIRDGTLQYRQNHIHGNPYLRLLRKEVEALVTELRGSEVLAVQKLRTELKSVETQIRSCKSKLKNLEKQKVRLSTDLEKMQTTT
jgi:septal ring factor EnvC (AmiA/AmiB activator)